MVLTIQVGNADSVIGGFVQDKRRFTSRIGTDLSKTADEYTVLLNNLLMLNGCSFEPLDGAIIASVVPPLASVWKEAAARIVNGPVLVVSPGIKTGLNIKIDDPAILGADLVSAAVGALKKGSMPCIIADLGAVTKLSVLDQNGIFRGVSILAGVSIALDALSRSSALLPSVEFAQIDHVIGTNSVDSMLSGALYGTASMLEGMVSRIETELGQPAHVILTGRMANAIAPCCRLSVMIDEYLSLHGLYAIYKRNTKRMNAAPVIKETE